MYSAISPDTPKTRPAHLFCLSIFFISTLTAGSQGWKFAEGLTFKPDLTLKETYDDNVFILGSGMNPAVVPPAGFIIARPKVGSFVTSVTPNLVLNYEACDECAATVSYAPEFTRYASAHSEDYVAHRAAVNFTGKMSGVSYEWLNSALWIDGSDEAPLTIRPGDIRAVGGIPIRDRRDAAMFRDSIKVTIPVGKWFFRPVFTSYIHDFQTGQHGNLTADNDNFLYGNYIDRWEASAGADIGYEVVEKTKMVLGYRYGHQDQAKAPNNAGVMRESCSINDYQRFLLGFEGTPAPWIKAAILGGPDLRDWKHDTPAGFERDKVLWYVDAAVTLLPTTEDLITLKIGKFEQPAFTSQTVYEDIKYDLNWRHKFSDKFTAGAGFMLFIGKWQAPVVRDDWIYTPSMMVSYAFTPHLTVEASWSYDYAVNQEEPVAGTQTAYADGREYTRNLFSITWKYVF